ncbi:hypothetical protein V8C42DRAFT_153450 [Trichoderma barbatum]
MREEATAALLRPFWCLMELSIQTREDKTAAASGEWPSPCPTPTSSSPHQPGPQCHWEDVAQQGDGSGATSHFRGLCLCCVRVHASITELAPVILLHGGSVDGADHEIMEASNNYRGPPPLIPLVFCSPKQQSARIRLRISQSRKRGGAPRGQDVHAEDMNRARKKREKPKLSSVAPMTLGVASAFALAGSDLDNRRASPWHDFSLSSSLHCPLFYLFSLFFFPFEF